jgi:flagellar protein FlaG
MNIQPVGTPVAQSAQLAGHAPVVAETPPPAAPSGDAAAHLQADAAKLSEAVRSINETMRSLAPGLEFSVDHDSHRTVVKIVDQETKELIRQMPTAEALEIAKALDRVQGLLISLRA